MAQSEGAGGSATAPGPAARIEGRVVTPAGAPVAGARVRLEGTAPVRTATTDAEGRFAFDAGGATAVTLAVDAPGFAPAVRRVRVGEGSTRLDIVLLPALREEIETTATRLPTRLSESPATVTVLSSEELDVAGPVRIDDVLRQVPGFSLFRRSGSRTANPTTQGVTLRGIGASGASRALVLDDGIPLNDPFGGWVYWGRVPRSCLDRIEVLEGGASDLYGSAALAGAVNMIRRGDEAPFVRGEVSGGSQSTGDLSLAAGGHRNGWGGIASGELFSTDGFTLVAPGERGDVDTPAGSRDAALDLTGERRIGDADRLFVRGSWFDESRRNGTPVQTNDTNIRQGAFGWDRKTEGGGLSLRLYGARQRYHQSFSAIAADRDSETLTRKQEVPSDSWGAGFQWNGEWGRAQRLVAGVDLRGVRGTSEEQIFSASGVTAVAAGGRQQSGGAFVEDIVRIGPRATLSAGVRVDHWRNSDGRRTTGGTTTEFPNRTEGTVSPRVSFVFNPIARVSLVASAYQSFRAPTLNELYRSFRVGNVLTQANEMLRAEHLTGGEAGVRLASRPGRLLARAIIFAARVEDPVANVTLSATPSLIMRQRQNLGRLRSRGIELEVEARPAPGWALAGGYRFTDSTVSDFPADRSLEGLHVPQVPRNELTAQGTYRGAAFGSLGVQARWLSSQFEDDRNTLPLASVLIVDGLYAHALPQGGWEAFVAGENLLDRRIEVGRTPVTQLGSFRTLRAGIRLEMGGRTETR